MHEAEDLRSIRLTLVVYIVIFAGKLAAYLLTGVMALFAEALHTLSDIFIAGFLLVALLWTRKKADSQHMLGHGRAQNAAALVAATLFISFTSFKLYEEAIPRLLHPHEAAHENLPLALGVLIVSMLIAAAPLITMFRQKTRGAAAKAQFIELINDELGLLAAMAGTLFVMWGKPIADPLAALFVATIIAINAVGLFRENLSFLLGRSPERKLMDAIHHPQDHQLRLLHRPHGSGGLATSGNAPRPRERGDGKCVRVNHRQGAASSRTTLTPPHARLIIAQACASIGRQTKPLSGLGDESSPYSHLEEAHDNIWRQQPGQPQAGCDHQERAVSGAG